MQRRLLVASLAAALTGTTMGVAGAQAGGSEEPALGDAERLHLKRTRAAGALSLALSRLAAKKGNDDDVKEFVQFEVSEQETLADILRTIELPGPVSGRVRAPSDADLGALLDSKSKDALQHLDGQKIGSPFDQEYIRLEIEGHKQLMDIQIDYLTTGRNIMSVAVAKFARANVKEHLTILSDIDAALGRG